jgi:AAA+ ATPase superfamily predicted ATPase
MGFTTSSILYSIDYELCIRAYLSGGKDLISSQPIHICPWDRETCMEIMKQINNSSSKGHRKEINLSDTIKELDIRERYLID